MSYYYDANEVKHRIGDSWVQILSSLAPELQNAISRFGRHTACPVHGGKDGFRLFKDAERTGGGVCNTCGPKNDGFELLMWLRGWDFNQTLTAVGDFVGAPKHKKNGFNSDSDLEPFEQFAKPKAVQAKSGDADSKAPRYRAKGNVVGFGSAPYKFDKGNDPSYYVTVSAKNGKEFTVWGVDLERAVGDSQISVGDYVTIRSLGKNAVTVLQPLVNADGEVIEEKQIKAYRTTFEIICNEATSDNVNQPSSVELKKHAGKAKDHSHNKTVSKAKPNKVWAKNEANAAISKASSTSLSSVKQSSKILTLWEQCLSLTSHAAKPAHKYFLNRGFAATLQAVAQADNVRFHPALEYYDEGENGKLKCIGKFPAIVSAIRNESGDLITLHRIYLSAQGTKAKVSAAKKMMAVADGLSASASAIQTTEAVNGVLGVAEGLETALAVFRATGLPTWSTISAQIMKSFVPPKDIHTVIVWADLDRSNTGESAAMALKTRLAKEGVKVLIALPQCSMPKKAKGIDWNDVLLEKGRLGFPNNVRLRKLLGV